MADKVELQSNKTGLKIKLSKDEAKQHMSLHSRKFTVLGDVELFTPKEVEEAQALQRRETKKLANKAVDGAVTNVGPQVADVAGENTSI